MTINLGTILVVDDDSMNRILLSTSLKEEGYVVETAEDGDYNLILLTSNGRGTFDRMIMGADSERIVDNTDRCVLMMPSRPE